MGLDLIGAYSKMYLIRSVESAFLKVYSSGKMGGTVHTCLGQEACAVGVLSALNLEKDVVFSNHRAHGHFIAYGGPLEGLIGEVLGDSKGVCKGIGGSQHLHYNNMYTNGIQAGMIPVAVGAALAEKRKNTGAVVVVFFGDGTMGQGLVYESFNFASKLNLPVVFILENNHYAQTTPASLVHSGKLEDRAKPYGINSIVIDGNDVFKVHESTLNAVAQVRENMMPIFIVLDTYRLGPHSKGDDFRLESEICHHREKDPIKILGMQIDGKERKALEEDIDDMVWKNIEMFMDS